MIFLLTAMKVYYIMDPNLEPILEYSDKEEEGLKEKRLKRAEDALLYHGHIMNALSDRL